MPADDDRLARDLAAQAGQRLLALRAGDGGPDDLRKAGDTSSHEFISAQLAARRPGDAVLSEEGRDNAARLLRIGCGSWTRSMAPGSSVR